MRTNLPGLAIGVPSTCGGVAGGLAPRVDDRAWPAQRLAQERGGTAARTTSLGSSTGICGAVRRAAVLAAGLAARCTLGRRRLPATDAERGLEPLLPAHPAAPPGAGPFGIRALAAIFESRLTGSRVSLPVALPGPLTAGGAQAPVRLVGIGAALAAEPARQTLYGPLAGAAVLGLARLGAPDALDAGLAAAFGVVALRDAALLLATLACASAFADRRTSAFDAQSCRPSRGHQSALTLATGRAPSVRVAVRHVKVSTGVMGAGPSAGRQDIQIARVSGVAYVRRRTNRRNTRTVGRRRRSPAPYRQ